MNKKTYDKFPDGTLPVIRLESQQQAAATVPAVPAVEARLLIRDYDEDDFINLVGFFKVLGALAERDENFQRTFCSNLVRSLYGKKHVFQSTLHEVLSAHIATHDHFAASAAKAAE